QLRRDQQRARSAYPAVRAETDFLKPAIVYFGFGSDKGQQFDGETHALISLVHGLGPPRPLFRMPLAWFSRVDATAADGSRFLIATPIEQTAPQTFSVVLNCQAELN